MNILITGAAGFIGYHLIKLLAQGKHAIVGIDNINDYYDVNLKYARLDDLGFSNTHDNTEEITSILYPNVVFLKMDICNKEALNALFERHAFDCVVNLAAQAGVRYSITNPDSYIASNVVGFENILECCRHNNSPRLIYASSSSVYGNTSKVPFREDENVDHPISLYAATKKSNELMAYTYSHLFGINTVGLRFFTVYGPSGRPDMAPMLFANAIREERTMKIFNNGDLSRDFTYVGDIVRGVRTIIEHPISKQTTDASTPAWIYNIGHGSPVDLMKFIALLEHELGKTLKKEYVGMQPGDVYQTWADTTKLFNDYEYKAETELEEGIHEFITWFKAYYKMN